jgi:S-adenosylmethionine:tRNA ribosyltransferase-isomerase
VRLSEFDYHLPSELIAQHPSAARTASRLLDARGEALADHSFTQLPELLQAGDLLVMNDTRVLKARLHARKPSGGRLELLVERIIADRHALAQWRASHPPALASTIELSDGTCARVLARESRFVTLEFDEPVSQVLERAGELPLPPYIEHAPAAEDEDRYQTVYARVPGAVAAPTAGLHFDRELIDRLERKGIGIATLTLHVGAGTFLPVKTDSLEEHVMHAECYEIPALLPLRMREARARGARVIAVGTTSLRALESAADPAGLPVPGAAETRLFIRPGHVFRSADALITNFHLPQSTLLVLVSAFAGRELIRRAYAHAIAERYRFFSYGDAMLLERA